MDEVVRPAMSDAAFLAGGGGVGALMRAHDWRTSPLGDPSAWPQSLRSIVGLLLNSKFPMFVAWGEELGFLYNDPYAEILGAKHPRALGRRFHDIWGEIWSDISPLIDAALAGEASWRENLPLVVNRGGFEERAWFTFSYSPVRDESGAVAGMFCTVAETTQAVLADRRLKEQVERQRRLFEQAPGFITILSGPELRFEFVNDAFDRLFGRRGFVGRTAREALPDLEGQPFLDLLDNAYATGERFVGRAMPIRLQATPVADATDHFLDFIYEPVRDDVGRVTGLFIEGFDVTDAHLAREALRDSEAWFRNMADHAPVMMWVTDPTGACTYLNRRWYEFTGQTEAEAEGFGWLEAVHPDDRGWSGDTFLAANAKREAFRLEYRLRGADGADHWAIDAASPRFAEDGAFLGYIGSVIDIEERRRVEDALRASEERYRTLFETIESGFCVVEVDLDGPGGRVDYRVVEANPAFFRQTGFPEAILGLWLREAAPALEEHWYETYGRVARTGAPERFEQGSAALGRWFDVYAFSMGEPAAGRVAILFNDISARRDAEERLRELNATLEARVDEALAERKVLADIVEGTDAFVQVADADFRWLAINRAAADEFERIYGARPQVGDSMLDLLADRPEHQAAVRAVWARALAGEEFTEVGEFGEPGRARRFYDMRFRTLRDARGDGIGAYQFVYDVTERMQEQARLAQAEEALRQSQKMEAVGQLTGGLAHDFNNLLAGISGSLELMGNRIAQGRMADVERYMLAAQGATKRAAALTHRLLAFSRRQTLEPKPTDVNRLMAGLEELIRRTVGPAIKVETVAQAGLWPTLVDPNQLENALLNLCINARDAMPEGGRLTIETANKWLDGRAAKERDLSPGQYVSLCVSDNGAGMTPDVVEKAFDPFFTTKPIGQGTGLGLSMIYGFTKQSGGQVRIYSEVGQGTMVCLYLPRHHGLEAAGAEASAAEPERPQSGAGETVLVVDDEPTVRMLVVDVVEELGFRALEAGTGPDGLEVLRSAARVDLLVTDVGLPGGLNGRQVADAARALRPGLPVLFITGYAENAVLSHGHLDPGMAVVTKPFDMARLASRIREMVEER